MLAAGAKATPLEEMKGVNPKTVRAACPNNSDLTELTQAAKAFTVSPDGRLVALLNKKVPRVRVNDVSGTGNVLTFEGHTAQQMEWSPSSRYFAFAEPGKIVLADVPAKAP